MSELSGWKVLLLGETGSGKTFSIRSLVEAGIEVFVIFTERSMQTLADLPKDRVHWVYVGPASIPWNTLYTAALRVNRFGYKDLVNMEANDKRDHDQFLGLIDICGNFTCERCGESFGDAGEWGSDRALVIDGLIGVSDMAMQLFTGSRPVLDRPHYQVAQRMVYSFLAKCCHDTSCWFVVLSHMEREFDEVGGGSKLMPSTVGAKLAPKLPRMFDEVIETVRDGDTWYWSTVSRQVAVKTRSLPFSGKLEPRFEQLVDAQKRHDEGEK